MSWRDLGAKVHLSATTVADGRVVTVAVDSIVFRQPVRVGDVVCCYTDVVRTGPITVDGMGPTEGWESYWKEFDARRRSGSSWAARTSPPLVA